MHVYLKVQVTPPLECLSFWMGNSLQPTVTMSKASRSTTPWTATALNTASTFGWSAGLTATRSGRSRSFRSQAPNQILVVLYICTYCIVVPKCLYFRILYMSNGLYPYSCFMHVSNWPIFSLILHRLVVESPRLMMYISNVHILSAWLG